MELYYNFKLIWDKFKLLQHYVFCFCFNLSHRPDIAQVWFLHGPEVGDGFYIFKLWDWGEKNILWHMKFYEIQIIVSINEVLLDHSHVYSFKYSLWVTSYCNDRVE